MNMGKEGFSVIRISFSGDYMLFMFNQVPRYPIAEKFLL